MNQYDEQAERRRARAERITKKTKDFLVDLLLEYHAVAGKKTAARKKETDMFLIGLVEKYEKRIVNYIREQLTSDDK